MVWTSVAQTADYLAQKLAELRVVMWAVLMAVWKAWKLADATVASKVLRWAAQTAYCSAEEMVGRRATLWVVAMADKLGGLKAGSWDHYWVDWMVDCLDASLADLKVLSRVEQMADYWVVSMVSHLAAQLVVH